MHRKRFIIVSSRVTRGGTLVLAAMCKLLIDKGYDAKLFYIHTVPNKETNWIEWWLWYIRSCIKMPFIRVLCALNIDSKKDIYAIRRELIYEPIKGLPVKYFPFFNKRKTIVIYPEILYGNFLKAKNVVRYLLSFNKLYTIEDKNSFGEKDLFIAYRRIFNDSILNPDNNIVCLHWFDGNLYRQYNFKERTGSCYLIRKGKSRPDLPICFDGPVIDNGMPEQEIVRVFNNTRYCFCYDTHTFYTIIAAVCGCIPIVIMEPGKTVSDYLDPDDKHLGIAYGFTQEQIQYAIDTRELLIESLNYRDANEDAMKTFISLIDHHFA